MGRVSKNSDDFLIRDPLNQPGVVEDVEPGIAPTDLLPTPYYADNMVRCAFCAQRQAHRRGYFAVLPDGALALCGHCCAVNIAGLATVQKIDRERKRIASLIRNRDRLLPVTHGVAELLETIEPLFRVEAKASSALTYLGKVFRHGIDQARYSANITKGRAGLVSIMKHADKPLKETEFSELAKKRETALNLIKMGIDGLPRFCAEVSPRSLRKRLGELGYANRCYLTYQNGTIVKLKEGWGEPDHLVLEELYAPDLHPVRELLTQIRSEAG